MNAANIKRLRPTGYRAPSLKRLTDQLSITREKAELIRGLIKGEVRTLDNPQFPKTQSWIASCYHQPRRLERIMACINEALDLHGLEAIWGRSCTRPVAEYCNTGDTYAATILFNYQTESFSLTSWGNFVERNQARYQIR